jgi:hypothetical protein
MWAKRNVYRLLVGKPEGKRKVGRPRRRWIDDITMDPVNIRLGGRLIVTASVVISSPILVTLM